MFGHRFFGKKFFGPHYFGPRGATGSVKDFPDHSLVVYAFDRAAMSGAVVDRVDPFAVVLDKVSIAIIVNL